MMSRLSAWWILIFEAECSSFGEGKGLPDENGGHGTSGCEGRTAYSGGTGGGFWGECQDGSQVYPAYLSGAGIAGTGGSEADSCCCGGEPFFFEGRGAGTGEGLCGAKAGVSKERGKGEFLSGFYKGDKLIPVVALVIFFSPDEWDGPVSLHEMMNVKDERILSLVPDYQIHLIAPAGLADEELKKFHSSLREVLGFIKYANDVEKMDGIVHGDFQKLRREEIDVLNQCVNVKLELPEGEETIDVCKAWEDMRREAAEKAEERTLLQNLSNMMKELNLSAEHAMAILKVPEAKRPKLSAKL